MPKAAGVVPPLPVEEGSPPPSPALDPPPPRFPRNSTQTERAPPATPDPPGTKSSKSLGLIASSGALVPRPSRDGLKRFSKSAFVLWFTAQTSTGWIVVLHRCGCTRARSFLLSISCLQLKKNILPQVSRMEQNAKSNLNSHPHAQTLVLNVWETKLTKTR